jgi:hypothetical protein
MEEHKFHAMLGRALVDVEFRDALTSGDADRQTQALAAIGVDANDDILRELDNSTDALQRLAGAFDPGIAAA